MRRHVFVQQGFSISDITYCLLPKNIAVILSVATNIAVIAVIITATGATWWLLFDTAADSDAQQKHVCETQQSQFWEVSKGIDDVHASSCIRMYS